jgi:hypothetical protein
MHADEAGARAEEARMEQRKHEALCDDWSYELLASHWFQETHHRGLLRDINNAKHHRGDDVLMKALRRRIDQERERWK